MKATTFLSMGEDALTRLNLLQRVANHVGLKLRDGEAKMYSEPIKEYTLDEGLLAVLAKHNITLIGREDHDE